MIQDPTGEVFCIWQAKNHHGTTVTGENGTFCWAKQFYAGVFGCKIGPVENYPPDYSLIENSGQLIGGIAPAHGMGTAPPHWTLFFLAADVDGIAGKAKELGGAMFSIIRPPQQA